MREEYEFKVRVLTQNMVDARELAASWERRAIVLEQKIKSIKETVNQGQVI